MKQAVIEKGYATMKLMDQVRETLRFYHYAYNTEKSYIEWILRFIREFQGTVY